MRMRTFHNRVESQEFTFDRADLIKALKASAEKWAIKPTGAVVVDWDLDWDDSDEDGKVKITLTQRFEYLSEAVADANVEPGAVPPQEGRE